MRFVEKYRPKRFDEVRGQADIINKIEALCERMKNGETDLSVILLGPAGCGKTTVARIMANVILGEYIHNYEERNASDERGIPFVRNVLKRFLRLLGKRFMLLDEADQLTHDAQHAMRGMMESQFDKYLVLSANNEAGFIEPLKSRCVIYRFKPIEPTDILYQLLHICREEGIDFSTDEAKNTLKAITLESKGDMRRAINTLDSMITNNNELTVRGVITKQRPNNASTALTFALHGDFSKAREMIETAFIQERHDPKVMIQDLYSHLAVSDEELESELTIRLFARLGQLDHAILDGGDPIVQFVAFMSFANIIPHLKGVFPV